MNHNVISEPTSAPYIFVSYAIDDEELITADCRFLGDQGFNLWRPGEFNPSKTLTGDQRNAIRDCALFLVFLSPRLAASEICRRECNYALDEGRGILIVQLEEADLPDIEKVRGAGGEEINKLVLSQRDYEASLISAIDELIAEQSHDGAPSADLSEIDKSWSIMIVGWFMTIGLIALGLMIWLEY